MKPLTKNLILLCAFIIFTSLCTIGSTFNSISRLNDAVLFKTTTYPVASILNVKVSTSGGLISVTGDATKEAILEMYVKSNNNRDLSDKEIQNILDRDYEITIQQQGNTLEAMAKRKSGLNLRNAISISFVLHTGSKVGTELSTSGGSIQLAGLSGNQNFRTSGGSLKIQNLKGNIKGSTSGGSIEASNSEGNIGLSTSGGSIKLDGLKGDINVSTSGGSIKGNSIDGSLVAKTSGGSINLEDLAAKVSASTSGGSVTAKINELKGDVKLTTSAGSITLVLPKNASANLNLKGSKINTNGLSNFSGTTNKGILNGSINGGGSGVQASTSAGGINLSFK